MTQHDVEVEVAIAGGGPVGMALAAMLVRGGMAPSRVALIDGRDLEAARRDPRSIAVSHGSRQLLEQIGAWPWQDGARAVPPAMLATQAFLPPAKNPAAAQSQAAGATAIEEIHVSRRGSFGRTLITAQQFGLPALGYVIRYGELVSALARAVGQAGTHMLRPVQVLGSDEASEAISLKLADRPALSTAIMVVAEGGVFAAAPPPASWTHAVEGTAAAGERQGQIVHAGRSNPAGSRSRTYDQTAVIAFVRSSAGRASRAYERFTEEGPLALLPQDDGYALVWCVKPDHAAVLTGLSDTAFLDRLQHAFGARLGRFVSASVRFAYPLGLKTDTSSSPRRTSIGNAAQTLHPVAGQGLNLGMRDAAVLAQILVRGATPQALTRFAAARRGDRGAIVGLTDVMARIFTGGADGSATQGALSLSLGLIDGLPPAKRLLGEWMMYGRRS